MANEIIRTFGAYNARRYGTPWVCEMTQDGRYNFGKRIGTYTGNSRDGDAGDLVVFDPVAGQVYGFGQKDYRKSSGTYIDYKKWTGEKFVYCDKLGREVE